MTLSKDSVVESLLSLRQSLSGNVPEPSTVPAFIDTTLAVLFPQLCPGGQIDKITLSSKLDELYGYLVRLCRSVVASDAELQALGGAFIEGLPGLHSLLLEDARAICQGDPAASSVDEVILAYPGFFAIAVYRLAHWLASRKVQTVPRMLSEYAHQRTGIDIHPGASIGRSFVIDHGTGIVIGETTLIHDNVKIYQGVTLGAMSVDKAMANKKRHPTIERDVVIYANATILGGDTVIGAGSVIGGNVWLTESVAPGSRVYHRR